MSSQLDPRRLGPPLRSPVERALWFIESHFAGAITLDEVAGICGLSRFQMSRLFSQAMGTSVTGYVRGRRLTEAARALAAGAPSILEVALQAGYGSHEAFARAFRDQFGLTPAEVRERRSLAGLRLVGPVRYEADVPLRPPPPRLEERGPLLIAGLGRRFERDDFAGIPALWQEFTPYLGAVPNQQGQATYGLVTSAAGGESYFYLAGVEVSDLSDLDGSLTGIRLPAQRWAAFSFEGHITAITSLIEMVFMDALPRAGLAPGGMPDVMERYDKGFDPWTGQGGFEVWVPVKR